MDLTRAEKGRINRAHLWSVLHEGKGASGRAFNFFLVLLILLSVAIVPLEFLPTYRQYSSIIHSIESVIIALFTVEYLMRLYAAPNRWKYLFSFFGIIDLLSIIPFYSGLFGTEYIRILRLVRLAKLAEMEAGAGSEESDTMQENMGLIPGEQVEYVVTKSPVTLIFGVIPSIVAITFGLVILLEFAGYVALAIASVLFLFALIFLWKTWLDFSYDVMFVTNLRLVFQNQHLLGRSINQVNYQSITNVKPFYPSPFSYIFRYGSLVIDTAAEHPGQIALSMIRRHEQAANVIMQKSFARSNFTGTITSTQANT
jgi:hypothetical protein